MITKIPFSLLPTKRLKKSSRYYLGIAGSIDRRLPSLSINLKQARAGIESKDYLAMCINALVIFFAFALVFFLILFGITKQAMGLDIPFVLVSFLTAFILSFFVFIQQLNYPTLLKARRIKSLDGNLLHALRNIMVQVSAGVPLFNVFMIIANGNYGEISTEFSMAVKEISSGKAQADAIKDLTTNNPSIFFRRAMWQLANGMKSGSDVSNVLDEIVKTTSEEQLVQITTYGSQLNPIAMFYMLLTVIIPSLSVTFMIVLAALLSLSEDFAIIIFGILYCLVFFMQIMFLGMIKAKRPTLMGE